MEKKIYYENQQSNHQIHKEWNFWKRQKWEKKKAKMREKKCQKQTKTLWMDSENHVIHINAYILVGGMIGVC